MGINKKQGDKMNYKEWAETVESEYTCGWGSGNENCRDIYVLPCGVRVHDETILPRHWAKKQRHQTLVDLIYPESEAERLKKLGADMDMDRYTEEGFGYPIFRGDDSLEKAFNFVIEEKRIKRG
jgi:hypothetical protein